MSIWKGLMKNACIIVCQLHRWFAMVQVLKNNSNHLGETHCILQIHFEFNPTHASWTIYCLQFPLHLTYAYMFNGCIGLTLDKPVLDLRMDVFALGQLYTVLSSVHMHNDCRLFFDDEDSPETVNIIYKDLLL